MQSARENAPIARDTTKRWESVDYVKGTSDYFGSFVDAVFEQDFLAPEVLLTAAQLMALSPARRRGRPRKTAAA